MSLLVNVIPELVFVVNFCCKFIYVFMSLFAAPVAVLNTASSKSTAKSTRSLPDRIILEIL